MTLPATSHGTLARGYATGEAAQAVRDLLRQLDRQLAGRRAEVVLYFASAVHDPAALAGPIAAHFPDACVLGCSSAGEFTDSVTATGGVSAVVLPEGIVVRAVAALGDLSEDAAGGTDATVAEIEAALGRPLRELDQSRYLGLVLMDGVHGVEQLASERLIAAAPGLDVVGGSAGDDLRFDRTWVAVGDRISEFGLALVICEVAVPFRVLRTCSYHPSGRTLQITRTDADGGTVLELDGRPAVDAYADAVGVAPADLNSQVWSRHPLGMVVDGNRWISGPVAIAPGGGLVFRNRLPAGAEADVMDPGDLVADTASAIERARAALGGQVSGAVAFNCILRRLEMDARHAEADFVLALGGVPTAGFHAYGETWLGHVNQTLTAVVFG
ncbi:MAG TPA: FIST N-terminal domain-containing protein [Kineosporiaceae bacterium]|nr:FIST N-terminal domain-containing protein [Kineosporiaceae bacterium]